MHSMRTTSLLRRAVVGAVLAAALTGCGDLAFLVDERVTITAPRDREQVTLPVTVTWDVRDFTITDPGTGPVSKDSGYFGVFVDQSPVPPGKKLDWIARNDDGCKPSEGCPDANYFRSLGVFTTTDTRLVIDRLSRHSGTDKERHTAIVVFLDSEGRRIGESAFRVVFEVKRSTL